jgi:peroxiredoxin
MKNILTICIILLSTSLISAQKTIPDIAIKTLNGKKASSINFDNDGNAYVLCFFATWCKPCLQELSAIADEYEDWQEESNFKLIAISVDDSKSNARLKSLVNGKDWPFEVYSDSNSDLKRALNVSSIPHAMIINNKNEVIYEKASYTTGSEFELYKKFLKINQK